MAMFEGLGLIVAFLAPMPAVREPSPEPIRWPMGGWMTSALIGLVVLATVMPVGIVLTAYRAEGAFRTRCEASGGRVSLTRDARHPYGCSRG